MGGLVGRTANGKKETKKGQNSVQTEISLMSRPEIYRNTKLNARIQSAVTMENLLESS